MKFILFSLRTASVLWKYFWTLFIPVDNKADGRIFEKDSIFFTFISTIRWRKFPNEWLELKRFTLRETIFFHFHLYFYFILFYFIFPKKRKNFNKFISYTATPTLYVHSFEISPLNWAGRVKRKYFYWKCNILQNLHNAYWCIFSISV
jgi:hypothetical protein